MPLYQESLWIEPVEFLDVFPDSETFEIKIESVGSDTEHLEELYTILLNKYAYAKTRYTTEEPFILAIRRELQLEWPLYLKQKALMSQMLDLDIASIMKSGSSLTNVVQTNDAPVVDADSVPISDLSTMQSNTNQTGNILNAILAKYTAIDQNYLNKIYSKMNPLFRQILSEEIPPILFPQEVN